MNAEADALVASLNDAREHVLGVVEELPEDTLRGSVLPSGWTPLGLVQHLAVEVEQFWFRGAVAGEPIALTSGDEAWQVPADVPATAFAMRSASSATEEPMAAAVSAAVAATVNGNVSLKDIARTAAREAERELILRMLTRTRWNRKEAAEILGISYKALLYKIKENGLDKAS